MLFGRTSSSEPSRFVREIKSEHLDRIDAANEFFDCKPTFKQKETNQWRKPQQYHPPAPVSAFASNFTSAPKSKTVQPALSLNKGDTIEHKAFGRGIVLNIKPAGGDALLEIAFDSEGTKRLMLNSAQRYLTKC
jgi:DNA helicase-2/ATP-dependent DNA helicase PcrA